MSPDESSDKSCLMTPLQYCPNNTFRRLAFSSLKSLVNIYPSLLSEVWSLICHKQVFAIVRLVSSDFFQRKTLNAFSHSLCIGLLVCHHCYCSLWVYLFNLSHFNLAHGMTSWFSPDWPNRAVGPFLLSSGLYVFFCLSKVSVYFNGVKKLTLLWARCHYANLFSTALLLVRWWRSFTSAVSKHNNSHGKL